MTPVPATQLTLLSYVTFLSRTLKPTSISNYINIIRLLHLDAGLDNPLANNFELTNLRRGIARELGSPPKQMLPITCELLYTIKGMLNFNQSCDIAFWAACILGFFVFLRKATLLPKSPCYPGSDCLLRKDLHILDGSSLELRIRKTKTIQKGERLLILPYCACPTSPLCPMKSVLDLLSVTRMNPDTPLFSYKAAHVLSWWTHASFVARLRQLLTSAGLDSSSYSGHSFRRGGATMVFKLGLSILQIKQRGDWRSSAVESYIDLDGTQKIDIGKSLIFGAAALVNKRE